MRAARPLARPAPPRLPYPRRPTARHPLCAPAPNPCAKVMMPPGAAEARGAQKAALSGVLHDKRTDAELGGLLDTLKVRLAALGPPASSGRGPPRGAGRLGPQRPGAAAAGRAGLRLWSGPRGRFFVPYPTAARLQTQATQTSPPPPSAPRRRASAPCRPPWCATPPRHTKSPPPCQRRWCSG